jgi:hypothetical protein
MKLMVNFRWNLVLSQNIFCYYVSSFFSSLKEIFLLKSVNIFKFKFPSLIVYMDTSIETMWLTFIVWI